MEKKTILQAKVQEEFKKKFKDEPYFSALPGERELCQMFNVSRPTIRKVLECLEKEGIIERVQGRGTFYIGNKMPIDYSEQSKHGIGLYSVLSYAGKITSSRVLQQDIEVPGKELIMRLQIPENELVFHLKRIRYVDGELYNVVDDYIPLKLCPKLMEVDFAKASLMKTMEENNIIPFREEKTIEIFKANAMEAAYLNLQVGDPISVTRIKTYDKNMNMIQYAISKSDAYKSRFKVTSTTHAEIKKEFGTGGVAVCDGDEEIE